MNRLRCVAGVLSLGVVLMTACGSSPIPTQGPGCRELRGMHDRPCDPAEALRSSFREDRAEAVSATGLPQLLVFYHPYVGPDDPSDCRACTVQVQTVQQLEAEYWDRIDFVYLNRDRGEMDPLLQEYGIAGTIEIARLNLILVDAQGEMLMRFYEGADLNRAGAEPPGIETYRTILDNQLAKLEED